MTTTEALDIGIFALGLILLVAGGFFSLAITVSQFHSMIGKALAWPLAPIVGLILGAHLGNIYLPDWNAGWRTAWFFGPGYFLVWMLVGICAHENLTIHYIPLLKKLFVWLGAIIKSRTTPRSPSGSPIRARAARRDDGAQS